MRVWKIGILIIILLIIVLFITNKRNAINISYEPPNNASYLGEEVKIQLKCGDVLAGTLTYPKENSHKYPAVVLITGSSAHDRDNSSPDKSVDSYRPFRQIADELSSQGIAVLRMDDRGVGASSGGDINRMTTAERADDIRSCLEYLKTKPEINHTRIGLIGLSEGASIAHMIAADNKSIKVLVLLSGIGSKGKEVIDYQINKGLINGEELPGLLETDSNLKYLNNFDPLQTASQIEQPVLIINGENDRRVPSTDADKLSDAITSNGNKNVTVHILSEYNHLLLKESITGVETD